MLSVSVGMLLELTRLPLISTLSVSVARMAHVKFYDKRSTQSSATYQFLATTHRAYATCKIRRSVPSVEEEKNQHGPFLRYDLMLYLSGRLILHLLYMP
jgi:hypothetical protein